MLASLPAGRAADRLGSNGPAKVLTAGVALSAAACAGFAASTSNLVFLALPFAAAGVAIGLTESAENSAVAVLAPAHLRGSAFGLLATVQAAGNLARKRRRRGAVDRDLPGCSLHLPRGLGRAGPGRPRAGRQIVNPRALQ